MRSSSFLLSSSFFVTAVLSAAVPSRRAAAAVALSTVQIDALTPFSNFAAAVTCQPALTANWTCGKHCDANADFQPTASGGDGVDIQFWYVGFSPSLGSVVVAHQGTNTKEIEPIITDAEFFLDELDPKLFPGVSKEVKAHSGFQKAHSRAAADVLNNVKTTMARTGSKNVVMASHSLGAAIALLDSLFLKLNLPADTNIKFVGYGMPRVGNKEFANLIDSVIPSVTRVNNQQDPVPIVPGRFMGFSHPSGEVHIAEDGRFLQCAGQESEQDGCTIDEERFIFQAEPGDHSGPYNGVRMTCGS